MTAGASEGSPVSGATTNEAAAVPTAASSGAGGAAEETQPLLARNAGAGTDESGVSAVVAATRIQALRRGSTIRRSLRVGGVPPPRAHGVTSAAPAAHASSAPGSAAPSAGRGPGGAVSAHDSGVDDDAMTNPLLAKRKPTAAVHYAAPDGSGPAGAPQGSPVSGATTNNAAAVPTAASSGAGRAVEETQPLLARRASAGTDESEGAGAPRAHGVAPAAPAAHASSAIGSAAPSAGRGPGGVVSGHGRGIDDAVINPLFRTRESGSPPQSQSKAVMVAIGGARRTSASLDGKDTHGAVEVANPFTKATDAAKRTQQVARALVICAENVLTDGDMHVGGRWRRRCYERAPFGRLRWEHGSVDAEW